MLNRIKLTNFRQHTDLEVVFGAGMTAIRGGNEAGKSTVLEAVAYAMFGSPALRDSVDDVVTWGEATASLRVELDFAVDGVAYTVKRSQKSAEINYDGGIVTNQKEVTAYICRLLKVDAGAAARLTMSNQNQIRGALEAGPKATTELIERLAEFDQIDTLVELIQEKLTLGHTGSAETAVVAAREGLARAEALAVPFDAEALQIAFLNAAHLRNAAEAAEYAADAAEVAAHATLTEVQEKALQRDSALRNVARTAGVVKGLREKLEVPLPPAPDNVEGKVTALRQQIEDVANASAVAAAFARVAPFTKARGPEAASYEGTIEALRDEIYSLSAERTSTSLVLANLAGEIRLAEQQLTHGSCTFCGKDFSGVPEVALKNSTTQLALDGFKASHAAASLKLVVVGEDIPAMAAIEKSSAAALKVLAELPHYAELADNELPPVLRWKGPEVTLAQVDVSSLKLQITALQSAQKEYDAAVVRREGLQAQLSSAQGEDSDAQGALVALRGVQGLDVEAAKSAYESARLAARAARTELAVARQAVTDTERTLQDASAAYERAVEVVVDMQEALAQREADLAAMEFNNALLKRVRQCRPIIADNLWNIVLAAVSSYFSEIRGVASVVSKGSDGFTVDAHSVTSMSGSTLDALGLAVRVALVRTFLPSAPFLILDEPAAAMDEGRTDNMLGFLSKCGFQQVLLVTHEEVSQNIADNLITL
jgi:AAA domain